VCRICCHWEQWFPGELVACDDRPADMAASTQSSAGSRYTSGKPCLEHCLFFCAELLFHLAFLRCGRLHAPFLSALHVLRSLESSALGFDKVYRGWLC